MRGGVRASAPRPRAAARGARRDPGSRPASASTGTSRWRDRRRRFPPPSARYATVPLLTLTQHYSTRYSGTDAVDAVLTIDSSAFTDDLCFGVLTLRTR